MEKNELTFGQKLAGVTFNPSGSHTVDDIKNSAAGFMDAIDNAEERFEDPTSVKAKLFEQAKLRALEAQMLAVKAATWKD